MSAGDIEYKVGLNKENDVLIDLGLFTRYVILTPEHALQLAEWLTKHANKSLKLVRSK